MFQVAVIFIQESRVSKKGSIKIPSYQIFEVVREDNDGGSILTAVHQSLNPVFISGGEDDLEILVVQAEFGHAKCRFINAYGPQETASRNTVIEFYSRLDQEIKNAKLSNCLLCLELDANAKLGPHFIPGDPHETSSNGEWLKHIILDNNLIICNASDKCDGLFTRERVTVNGHEKSIIDVFLM